MNAIQQLSKRILEAGRRREVARLPVRRSGRSRATAAGQRLVRAG